MIGLKKLVVVVITALSFLVPTTAQVSNNVSEGSFYLGKIPVYKFKMDSLSYHNDKTRLSAVGTEFNPTLTPIFLFPCCHRRSSVLDYFTVYYKLLFFSRKAFSYIPASRRCPQPPSSRLSPSCGSVWC